MILRNTVLPWICALLATSAWSSSVFLHWTAAAVPPMKALGVNDLVVSWDGGFSPAVKTARNQGYRVYVEASPQQLAAVAEAAAKNGLAGIILNVRQSERGQAEEVLRKLRSTYPKLRFLVLNPDGKQPQMRGGLVIKRGDILEVSSPTAQPWIDTNLALARIEQMSHPEQVPLYSFSWALSDPLRQQQGPTAEDYSLAVGEAGAFHADLLLELNEDLQKGLAQNDARAWTQWNQVKPYLEFYSHTTAPHLEPAANVGVLTDNLDASYEAVNLLARHNIPFRVLAPAGLKSVELEAFDIVVVFAKPDQEACARIAARGGIVVLVDAHGAYPWQTAQPIRMNEHAVSYAVGNGRVLELSEPVTDPETFAQDIRRLMGKQNVLVSLWNALTTVAVPYQEHRSTVKILDLVNYAAEPLRLQVQVRGSFNSIRYETPEHACCESLTPVEHDGFTEFVVPGLRIAGRVHLEAKNGGKTSPTPPN